MYAMSWKYGYLLYLNLWSSKSNQTRQLNRLNQDLMANLVHVKGPIEVTIKPACTVKELG